MKFITFFFFVCCFVVVLSQKNEDNYYECLNYGVFYASDLSTYFPSPSSLKKANDIVDNLNDKFNIKSGRHLYAIAKIKAQIKDTVSAIKYLERCILNGMKIEKIKKEEVFTYLFNTSLGKVFESKYPSLRRDFFCSSNVEHIIKLEKLKVYDISLKQHYYRFKGETDVSHKDFRLQDSITDINFRKYIEENGYPDVSEIGYYLSEQIAALVLHIVVTFPETWDYYKPVLDKARIQGNIDPHLYANLVDFRLCTGLGKKEIYGSDIFTVDKITGERHLREIEDIKNVDRRRKEIGLAPLYFKLKIFDITTPKGYIFDKLKYSNFTIECY